MNPVWATARLELRQTLRSPGFWVLQGLLLLSGLLHLISDGPGGPQLRYAAAQLRHFAAFQWLLLLLLAWPALRRVAGRSGQLPLATPIRSTGLALGTVLGIFLWWVPATYAQLAARWLLGQAVEGQASWALLSLAPGPVVASALLALGLAACLSLAFQQLLPTLLVWLGVWILILVRAGGPWGGFVGPPMPLFDPFNVFFEGLMLSPAIGLGLMQPLVTALSVLVAAAGVMLLMLWVVLLPVADRRRLDPSAMLRYALLGISVLLVGWAAFHYQSAVDAEQPVQTPAQVRVDEWRVISADTTVVFAPAEGEAVSGRAQFILRPTTETWPRQLVLRLNPGIDIVGATTDLTLEFQRMGDSYLIELPDSGDAGQDLELAVAFSGTPTWPYADHRFRQGTTFPALDSSQPMTSLAIDGMGFLLRDGDWLPWPWTSRQQTAEAYNRMSVTTVDATESRTYIFLNPIPALVGVVPPDRRAIAGSTVHVGRDPGAGLSSALEQLAARIGLAWPMLGEPTVPEVVAMPYLQDAYANDAFLVVPEAFDIENGDRIGAAYQTAAPAELRERAALQLLARAWLNGQVDGPRGFAVAHAFAADLRRSLRAGAVPEPTGHRLLLVTGGITGSSGAWPVTWQGANPAPYDVTPFALWLGMELASEEVRAMDAALLAQPSPSDQFVRSLRERLLPAIGLMRAPAQLQLLQDLIAWSDRAGEEAVDIFVGVVQTSSEHSHEAVLSALGAALPEQVERSDE